MVANIVDEGTRFLWLGGSSFLNVLYKDTEDLTIDGYRIRDEVGFKPRYDLISGWEEAVEGMRPRGEL
jgi:nucleoside-diphosphate-sugar epimerase